MQKLELNALVDAVASLHIFHTTLPDNPSLPVSIRMDELAGIENSVITIVNILKKLGLRTSLKTASELRKIFDDLEIIKEEVLHPIFVGTKVMILEHSFIKRAKHYAVRLHEILCDELSYAYVLILDDASVRLYDPPNPLFGSDVDAKFPSLSYEISEAGKCLALGRSTAAAFHIIRCLEGGIQAISRCLGLPDPVRGSDRNWSVMLRKIKDDLERRWPSSSARMKHEYQEFEGLYAALAAMQNPWRNATMHLDQRYTQEEALHIFEVVKGFLSRLAKRCDEMGVPQA